MQTMHRTGSERKGLEYYPCFAEIKEYSDAKGTIGGLLNRIGNIDLVDDRSMKGAFVGTIARAYQRKAAENDPFLWRYLYNHNADNPPVGGIYDADEIPAGLYTRVQFNLDLAAGRDIYNSFRGGFLKSQSMGYKTLRSEFVKDKDTGRTIRNLLEVEVIEGSAVIFAANPLSTVDQIKRFWPGFTSTLTGPSHGSKGTTMSTSTKDFTSNYQAASLDDWANDDWSGISAALQQSILELFTPGSSPLDDFDREVLPGLLAALRQYISDGIALGYVNGPSSAAGVTPMMMSMPGAGRESKAGYLNSSDHAAIKESSTMIMKHARIIASAAARVESANARARAGQLAGWPVYGAMSEPSIFEEKE